MVAKKPAVKGKAYRVIRDGYYPNGQLAEVGSTITLPTAEAGKLLHRGIIEEKT